MRHLFIILTADAIPHKQVPPLTRKYLAGLNHAVRAASELAQNLR
jgi:hypothetical protein